jgi:uncharacterized protein (DUF58 family)
MIAPAVAQPRPSPVSVSIESLIRQKPAGESIKISAPRIRVLTAGGHVSSFKGRGVEFDESRPYQAGDDLRTIDWRVTARTGKPHTKVFREERNRPIIAWIDLRRPMMFATRGAYKAVIAAEAAALVAWSAVAHGDRLGGLVFSDTDHHELRPALGRRAALRLLRRICDSWQTPESAGAESVDTGRALLRLTRVARPGSLICLISDFRNMSDDGERHLRRLAIHSDLLLIHVYDSIEAELPPPGRYRIQVGQRSLAIETGDKAARDRYRRQFEERRARLQQLQQLPSVAVVECRTHEDPRLVLANRFRKQ